MKKGVSTVFEYMLLVLMAISIASGAAVWLIRTGEETREDFEEAIDEENIRFYISDVERNGGEMNVTIVNNGRFSIPAEEIRAFYEGDLKENIEQIEGQDPIPPGESATFRIENDF